MNRVTSTITMSNERAPEWMPAGSSAWHVVLRYRGRSYTVPMFSTGPGWDREPTTADVVESVLSSQGADEQSFEEWCGDFGYDTDSRKALATFKACRVEARAVRRLLGDDLDVIAAAVSEGNGSEVTQ